MFTLRWLDGGRGSWGLRLEQSAKCLSNISMHAILAVWSRDCASGPRLQHTVHRLQYSPISIKNIKKNNFDPEVKLFGDLGVDWRATLFSSRSYTGSRYQNCKGPESAFETSVCYNFVFSLESRGKQMEAKPRVKTCPRHKQSLALIPVIRIMNLAPEPALIMILDMAHDRAISENKIPAILDGIRQTVYSGIITNHRRHKHTHTSPDSSLFIRKIILYGISWKMRIRAGLI